MSAPNARTRCSPSKGRGESVLDDEASHEFWAPPREAEPNRPSPILYHDREILQAEVIDEMLNHDAMLTRVKP